MTHQSGRHFLQIPGPTNVPERVLRAMGAPTIDHRGPAFQALTAEVLEGMGAVLQTQQPVVLYPASGTGAWEAALVNTLSPGDRVLMAETGHFATLWKQIALKHGLVPEFIPGDWRHGVDATHVEASLAGDSDHAIKAVCVVHNETSTGVTSDVPAVRRALDSVGHSALLLVDTISSLSWVSRQKGQASILAYSLNRSALPSMTGSAAKAPILPSPRTADPSLTTATVLFLMVKSRARLPSSAINSQGRATPGV